MNPKFWGMLGLAMRAGKLAVGEGRATDAVRSGQAALLLVACDASANTAKKFKNMAEFRSLPMVNPGDRFTIGKAVGKQFVVVLAVTDAGMAKQMILLSGQEEA